MVKTGQQVAAEIIDFAKEVGAELIVMCTHGRSGITRWYLGVQPTKSSSGPRRPSFSFVQKDKCFTVEVRNEKGTYLSYLHPLLTFLSIYLLYQILSPFLSSIVWAILLAMVLYPVYKKLRNLLRKREILSASS